MNKNRWKIGRANSRDVWEILAAGKAQYLFHCLNKITALRHVHERNALCEAADQVSELEASMERMERRYDVASYMLVEGARPDQPGGCETDWLVDLYDGKGERSFDRWEEMLDHVARESGLKVPCDVESSEGEPT